MIRLCCVALLYVFVSFAFELKGVGVELEHDVNMCHACAAVITELGTAALKHQGRINALARREQGKGGSRGGKEMEEEVGYYDDTYNLAAEEAAVADDEDVLAATTEDERRALIALKVVQRRKMPGVHLAIEPVEAIVESFADDVCSEEVLGHYDRPLAALVPACRRFMAQDKDHVIEFATTLPRREMSVSRGVEVFCAHLTTHCDNMEIVITRHSAADEVTEVARFYTQEEMAQGKGEKIGEKNGAKMSPDDDPSSPHHEERQREIPYEDHGAFLINAVYGEQLRAQNEERVRSQKVKQHRGKPVGRKVDDRVDEL